MQVSGRARLAWANRNFEEAADVIASDALRLAATSREINSKSAVVLLQMADELDPEVTPK